ncbi:MAG: hypothetical protein ACKVTZ_22255 [Bacteroidia bacterium]
MNKTLSIFLITALLLASCSWLSSAKKAKDKLSKDDLYAYVFTERYVDPHNPSKSYTQIFDGKENRLKFQRVPDWSKGKGAIEARNREIILAGFQYDSLNHYFRANKLFENYKASAFYEVKEDSVYPTRYYTLEVGRDNKWTRIAFEGMDKEVKRDKYYKRMEKLETLLEDFVGVENED